MPAVFAPFIIWLIVCIRKKKLRVNFCLRPSGLDVELAEEKTKEVTVKQQQTPTIFLPPQQLPQLSPHSVPCYFPFSFEVQSENGRHSMPPIQRIEQPKPSFASHPQIPFVFSNPLQSTEFYSLDDISNDSNPSFTSICQQFYEFKKSPVEIIYDGNNFQVF